eukprot:COSAG05_NODE_3166_length_2272_cov_1.248044_2_plen_293_part_00
MFGDVVTAMATPFSEDGSVNYDEACRLALHLVANGSDTVLLSGTTGESPTLTHKEELILFTEVVKAIDGRAKVMAGTGSNCTRTAVEASRAAADCGVDALLQVVPYYNKPTQAGLQAHFKAVAAASDLPVMLYNIPGRTGLNMAPETVAALAAVPEIVAIKEAAGSVEQLREIRAVVPEDFMIYSGDDALTLAFMKEGACGVVSVASHCAGKEIKQMVQAYHAKSYEQAERIHSTLTDLFSVLFITANPIPLKAALKMMGFSVGSPRLPLLSASEAEEKQVRDVLISLDILS